MVAVASPSPTLSIGKPSVLLPGRYMKLLRRVLLHLLLHWPLDSLGELPLRTIAWPSLRHPFPGAFLSSLGQWIQMSRQFHQQADPLL
jgi:hypothetical protein